MKDLKHTLVKETKDNFLKLKLSLIIKARELKSLSVASTYSLTFQSSLGLYTIQT